VYVKRTIAQTIEKKQVTTFDHKVQASLFERPGMTSDPFWTEGHRERKLDLNGIMERPIEVANFTWAQSDGQFKVLHNSIYPKALLANPNLKAKANYNTYFRANVKVRVLVNSTPFMVGKLWLYYSPYQTFTETVPTSLAEVTGYPGIELDIGTAQSMELMVPYCSPLSAINLVTGEGQIGEFSIVVLNPLVAANNSEAVSVSVVANFENAELSLPTAHPIFDFSGTGAVAQAAGSGKDEGEEMSEKGVISGAAAEVAEVANVASGLPVIGPVAKTVSWVADAVSGAARFFGFNKPNSQIAQHPICNVPARGWTNADGLDNSVMLGASPENETVTRHVFSTSTDEMDVAYVARKSCFLTTYNWSLSDEPGKVLAAIPVHPGASITTTDASLTAYHPTLLGFASSVFQYWRGSLVYRLSFAKNAFYAGRVKVVYVPQASSFNPAGFDFNQAPNTILDISSNQHEVTVPWVYNVPWARSRLHGMETADLHCMTGMLYVIVYNQLRAPDTVPQSIQFNVWVAGGEDIEFAIPDCSRFVTVALNAQIDDEDDGLAEHDEQMRPGDNPILESSTNVKAVDASALTVGERCTNFRVVTRRFTEVGTFAQDHTTQRNCYDPSSFGGSTALEYISAIYRFYKGSQRYKFYYWHPQAYVGTGDVPMMVAWLDAETSNAPLGTTPTSIFQDEVQAQGNNQFLHRQNPILNQVMEVAVPFYSNTPIGLISNKRIEVARFRPLLWYSSWGKLNQVTTVMRAAGDDFSMGFLVGAPRLYKLSQLRAPRDSRARLGSVVERGDYLDPNDSGVQQSEYGQSPIASTPRRNRSVTMQLADIVKRMDELEEHELLELEAFFVRDQRSPIRASRVDEALERVGIETRDVRALRGALAKVKSLKG